MSFFVHAIEDYDNKNAVNVFDMVGAEGSMLDDSACADVGSIDRHLGRYSRGNNTWTERDKDELAMPIEDIY